MRKDLYTNGSVDIPKISKGRSFFDLSHSSHITMNSSFLYPIDSVIQVVPGDTFDYSHKLNLRMTNPPKTPTMDLLCLDLFYFYVPHRIVWDDFDKFITGYDSNFYNPTTPVFPTIDIVNPSLSTTYYASLFGSVLDYQGYGGINFQGSGISADLNPSALPPRGYYLIWNEYFRYESLQQEVLISHSSGVTLYNTVGINTGIASNYFELAVDSNFNNSSVGTFSYLMGGQLFKLALCKVNRLPGYFSRALPQPLAGSDVKILEDIVIGTPRTTNGSGSLVTGSLSMSSTGMTAGGNTVSYLQGTLQDSSSNNIRALSNAFALNKFLFIDNVYGRRITEWTYGHFAINVPDSRVQRPEFLAKRRVYININQIMQSSETTQSSPQGNAGAWSQTFDSAHDFSKSFVEYGYIHALGCIRVLNHTYAQGIEKHWNYRSRYDFYLPEFNNVGDQPIYQKEIYANTTTPTAVFGYQERYADLKMIPSRVAGLMRPQVSNNLAIWTYTDYYTSAPLLSALWMFEPQDNINRTFFFSQSDTVPGFILDYVTDIKAYRTMPYHSIPGGLTGSW